LEKYKSHVKDTIIRMILIFLLAPVVWNIQLIELESIQINRNQTMETLAIQATDGITENHIKMKKAQTLGSWFLFALLDLLFSKHFLHQIAIMISKDSKLIIQTSFHQQAQMHHHHTLPVILQETLTLHHRHQDIHHVAKNLEMVDGEILRHLVLGGLQVRGGIETQPDHEIEFILIYILNVIEGMDFLV